METNDKKIGFALMSPAKLKEISSRGGKSAINRHKWTSEEARAMSLKGHEARKLKQSTSMGNI